MITNADITVYNRYYDRKKGYDTYRRTVIRGVWFFVDHKVQITDSGVLAADIYKVRIPLSADTDGAIYVPPDQYTGVDRTWTLHADDYVCKGVLLTEIEKPAELKKETNQVFKITSWSDNRFGTLPHWRIGGIFQISTPRGEIFQSTNKGGKTTAKLEWSPGYGPKKAEDFSKAQEFVDSECLRYMNPLTPRRSGYLIKSATLGTVIGSGEIEYLAPYARRQYYENKGAEGARGKHWFERMKAQKEETIRKGAAKFAAGT
ncbi:MAG: DUF6751 family protein [Hungatella sp.]